MFETIGDGDLVCVGRGTLKVPNFQRSPCRHNNRQGYRTIATICSPGAIDRYNTLGL